MFCFFFSLSLSEESVEIFFYYFKVSSKRDFYFVFCFFFRFLFSMDLYFREPAEHEDSIFKDLLRRQKMHQDFINDMTNKFCDGKMMSSFVLNAEEIVRTENVPSLSKTDGSSSTKTMYVFGKYNIERYDGVPSTPSNRLEPTTPKEVPLRRSTDNATIRKKKYKKRSNIYNWRNQPYGVRRIHRRCVCSKYGSLKCSQTRCKECCIDIECQLHQK